MDAFVDLTAHITGLLEQIPLVGWLFVLVAILGGLGVACYALAKKGWEYGLNFLFSIPFGALFLFASAIAVSVLLPLFGAEESEVAIATAQENFAWGGAGYIGIVILAYLYNGYFSNFGFALPYTFFQALLATLTVLLIVLLFLRHKGPSGRRKLVR